MSLSWPRGTTAVSALCLALSLVVFLARGRAMWHATQAAPGVAVTSGFEEESLFAVWRAAHGQPVYADATRLPFASAYFNWLFYAGYAGPVKLAAARWGDANLPQAARLVTVAGAVLGGCCLAFLLRQVTGGTILLPAALAGFVFGGPLVSWWSFTARPDVWALTFETLALAVLLRGWRTRPVRTAVLTAGLFYCAWACKSTYVAGLAATLLFLLYRRQWRALLVLTGASGLLWVATFALLGPEYRAAFAATARVNLFFLSAGLGSLRDMLFKTAPLWLLAAGLAARGAWRGDAATPLGGDALVLGALGLLVALPLNFAGTCKFGAVSYYYFPSLLLLALLVGALAARRSGSRLIPAGLVLAAGLQVLALLGHAGRVNLTEQTESLGTVWKAWRNEASPRFSALNNLNLPWLNSSSPPLVLAFNYGLERSMGHSFERNGVGGMISEGYFRSLLLPANTTGTYDGGSLSRYVRGEQIGEFAIFRRLENSVP